MPKPYDPLAKYTRNWWIFRGLWWLLTRWRHRWLARIAAAGLLLWLIIWHS